MGAERRERERAAVAARAARWWGCPSGGTGGATTLVRQEQRSREDQRSWTARAFTRVCTVVGDVNVPLAYVRETALQRLWTEKVRGVYLQCTAAEEEKIYVTYTKVVE